MKKTTLLALLLFGSLAFSQEKKEDPLDKFHIYVGAGYNFNSSFAINSKLENSGIPASLKDAPDFNIGWSRYDKKIMSDLELCGNFINSKSNSNLTASAGTTNVRWRLQYNFINNNHYIFSGGLNLAYTANYIAIYNNNNQVDLNNITTNNSNYVSLYNSMFYIGPSIGFTVKGKKGLIGKINAGYEIAAWSGDWKSSIANVSNSINEKGQSRLMIGGVFYIFDLLDNIK